MSDCFDPHGCGRRPSSRFSAPATSIQTRPPVHRLRGSLAISGAIPVRNTWRKSPSMSSSASNASIASCMLLMGRPIRYQRVWSWKPVAHSSRNKRCPSCVKVERIVPTLTPYKKQKAPRFEAPCVFPLMSPRGERRLLGGLFCSRKFQFSSVCRPLRVPALGTGDAALRADCSAIAAIWSDVIGRGGQGLIPAERLRRLLAMPPGMGPFFRPPSYGPVARVLPHRRLSKSHQESS